MSRTVPVIDIDEVPDKPGWRRITVRSGDGSVLLSPKMLDIVARRLRGEPGLPSLEHGPEGVRP